MEARPQVRCPPSSSRPPRESVALAIPQPSRPPVPSPWLALSGPPVDCHGASSGQQEQAPLPGSAAGLKAVSQS